MMNDGKENECARKHAVTFKMNSRTPQGEKSSLRPQREWGSTTKKSTPKRSVRSMNQPKSVPSGSSKRDLYSSFESSLDSCSAVIVTDYEYDGRSDKMPCTPKTTCETFRTQQISSSKRKTRIHHLGKPGSLIRSGPVRFKTPQKKRVEM